ncbi:twinkle protein [Tropilaelaps mercedesae]|uniref:Twinkle protein n=1 Tax=Tropilaelaps mercedesae TaxID=418985 RepID=A0A1V9XXR5_9ACAR|nr:twinkle protein [Tropilaelaps mercedesae]
MGLPPAGLSSSSSTPSAQQQDISLLPTATRNLSNTGLQPILVGAQDKGTGNSTNSENNEPGRPEWPSALSNSLKALSHHYTSRHEHQQRGGYELIKAFNNHAGSSRGVSLTRIKQILGKKKVPFQSGFTCLRIQCPQCLRKSKDAQGYLNTTTGTFICYDCNIVAQWESFHRAVQTGWDLEGENQHPAFATIEELEEIQRRIQSATEVRNIDANKVASLLKHMGLERIQVGTLVRSGYHISVDDGQPKILLPIRGYRQKLIGLKYLGEEGNVVETYPREEMAGYFHATSSIVPNRAVLVAHPADAIFVTQETQLPAIAVESTSRLPITSIPLLEHYDQLTIWFGNALNEWENAKNYARKLGENRSRYIRQTPEYDRPLKTKNVIHALKLDTPILHQSLVTFKQLRLQVYDHLMQWEQASGIKWTRFPGLNKYIKGHRRGELTVFTGQTGSGKTTFLCEYSLDLLQQGVRTLWGSFEIPNTRLLKTMLTQFALEPLESNMDRFDEFADGFAELPLYMMKFHGQEKIKNVLDTMSHAVYVNDIQHVVVDNLQFMMGMTEDRFHLQDTIVSSMRRFATEHNVHVTLVIHPRKEKEEEMLGTASIFGTAKASQEADNIMILQKSPRNNKYIQVTKNRFDGDLGSFSLSFDKPTLSFWRKLQQKELQQQQIGHGTNDNAESAKKD